MRVPALPPGVLGRSALLAAAFCLSAHGMLADEIRLKDGKKLYGVIVAYEDNMFKVKTDYGFVLVEKDKIAAIVPTTPANAAPANAAAKPPKSSDATAPAPATDAAAATSDPTTNAAAAPAKPKISADPVRPNIPANSGSAAATKVAAPAIKSSAQPANLAAATSQPAPPPKEPELPPNREEVTGTLYTNFSHGFKMYKAPSWELIEDARKALPNAIVAMGTSNESTLMVVGQEKAKDTLEASANAVEKRMSEIYSNYRRLSQRKTVVGGAPAIEFKYRDMADEHDWSGTLVIVARGKDVFTMLGMTYADTDLIQIQENVIARAINSTDFNVH